MFATVDESRHVASEAREKTTIPSESVDHITRELESYRVKNSASNKKPRNSLFSQTVTVISQDSKGTLSRALKGKMKIERRSN